MSGTTMTSAPPDQGFAFPLQVDHAGGIAEASGAEKIRLSVLTILGTHPGERVMRPTFGCPLRSLAFAPLNAATASLAQYYVRDALTRWEPRIQLDDVQATPTRDEKGQPMLFVNVTYHLRFSGNAQTVNFQLPLA
jgi:Bacteriophage baseplate protein W